MSRLTRPLVLAILLVAPAAGPARSAEHFIDSDDYKDGEEIVDVFLKAGDYRLMVEDIERNGEAFDWGWAKTPEPVAAAPAPEAGTRPKGLRWLPKRSAGGRRVDPRVLSFDLASYRTIAIPEVKNFAGLIPTGTQGKVHEAFAAAAKELGLELTADSAAADLLLEVAIVDLKQDSTYIYFATIQPFIELEVRLRDLKTGDDLLLLRNQAHSDTVDGAAFRYASTLIKFLR